MIRHGKGTPWILSQYEERENLVVLLKYATGLAPTYRIDSKEENIKYLDGQYQLHFPLLEV
jgi:hypothetical protein